MSAQTTNAEEQTTASSTFFDGITESLWQQVLFIFVISAVVICVCCCIAYCIYSKHRNRGKNGIDQKSPSMASTGNVSEEEPNLSDILPEVLHELRDEIQEQQQQEQKEQQQHVQPSMQPALPSFEAADSKQEPMQVPSMSPSSDVLPPMSTAPVYESKYKSRSQSIQNEEYHKRIKDQVQDMRDRMDSTFKITTEVTNLKQNHEQLAYPPPSSLENATSSSYSNYKILREYAKLGHRVHLDRTEFPDFDPNLDDDEKNTQLSNHEHEDIQRTRSSLTIPMGAMSFEKSVESNAPSINDSDFHIIPEEYTVQFGSLSNKL